VSLPSGNQIINEACAEFGYSRAALLQPVRAGGRGERNPRALARDATMYRLRERGLSYPRIAHLMGLTDHTSARSAVQRHAESHGLDIPPNKDFSLWSEDEIALLERNLLAPHDAVLSAFPQRGRHAVLVQRARFKKARGLTRPYARMAEASA